MFASVACSFPRRASAFPDDSCLLALPSLTPITAVWLPDSIAPSKAFVERGVGVRHSAQAPRGQK